MGDIVALDLEQEFVNHLAIADSLEYILREGVSPELFFGPRTKAVYAFVQHHFTTTGKLPSLKVLATEFPNLVIEEPDAQIQYIVDKLRERFQRNKIGDLVEDVAKEVMKRPEDAMRMLRDATFDLERNSLSSRHVWRPGDHKIFIRDLQQQIMAGHFQGASIGFKEIDDFTGGAKKGNVVYLMAREKRQKTFLSLNAFIQQAREGWAPYFPTLENTEQEIMLRLSCMLSGVPWDMAQKGQLTSKEFRLFDKAWEEFNQYDHTIEMPPPDERTVPILMSKADKVGAGSMIISQFKYIQGTKDWYRTDADRHAEIALDLKAAATRAGKERPIIVEAQFNRGGDEMEELADFTGSMVGLTTMIEQSADTLYGIFRNKDMRLNNTLEFGILIGRNHGQAAWFIESDYVNKTEIRLQTGSKH